MMKIDGFNNTDLAKFGQPAKPAGSGSSFLDTLKEAIDTTNQSVKEADKASLELATGQNTNIHEAMIAGQKASIEVQFMVKATNKLIQGYNELMNIR